MNKTIIKCICGKELNNNKFKNHFRNCNSFFDRFKQFDMKISFLLSKYLAVKENVILVLFLFKEYIKLIEKKINSNIQNKIQKCSNDSYSFKKKFTSNGAKKRLSFNINNIILGEDRRDYITYNPHPRLSTEIIKKSFLYENILKSFSNQNKKQINNLNLVKELIEDQKNFYSSFPAPIIPIEKSFIKNGNNKLISYKRHSIFIPIGNEAQLQIEKSFYLNWKIIRNVNSETGYLIVKKFRSLFENEKNKIDNIKIKFSDFYKDDTDIIKSKKAL
jgi:hypothetical protein